MGTTDHTERSPYDRCEHGQPRFMGCLSNPEGLFDETHHDQPTPALAPAAASWLHGEPLARLLADIQRGGAA